jgi:predicted helicase
MATFDEFISSLDPENDKKGGQFEYFVKWFLKNDPEWVTQVDEV